MNDNTINPDRIRTTPWALDELVIASGWRLVYSADKVRGITAVHLPGRRSLTLEQLRAAGHSIVLPKRVRWGG